MLWLKTEAGRQEIKARSLVSGRAQRTLLLLADGKRGEGELLALVAGTSQADLDALAALGLIVAVDESEATEPMQLTPRTPAAPADTLSEWSPTLASDPGLADAPGATASAQEGASGGYDDLSSALTETIARELGLRGFVLTMAVERASTLEELRAVAERTITAVTDRKGLAQGRAVRRALFGE